MSIHAWPFFCFCQARAHPNSSDVAVRNSINDATHLSPRLNSQPVTRAVQEYVLKCDVIDAGSDYRPDAQSSSAVVLPSHANPAQSNVTCRTSEGSDAAPHINRVLVCPEVAVLDQGVPYGRYDNAVAVANMRGHVLNVQIVNQREVQREIA